MKVILCLFISKLLTLGIAVALKMRQNKRKQRFNSVTVSKSHTRWVSGSSPYTSLKILIIRKALLTFQNGLTAI